MICTLQFVTDKNNSIIISRIIKLIKEWKRISTISYVNNQDHEQIVMNDTFSEPRKFYNHKKLYNNLNKVAHPHVNKKNKKKQKNE